MGAPWSLHVHALKVGIQLSLHVHGLKFCMPLAFFHCIYIVHSFCAWLGGTNGRPVLKNYKEMQNCMHNMHAQYALFLLHAPALR